jgi:signal transduction histidine kinase
MQVVLKETGLMFEADSNLIEQVLINLVVNSIEGVKDKSDSKIVLSAYRDTNNKIVIKVADNGAGMPAEMMDKIFIPFFTTKKNGSGIGLSLCKQIMMLHKGNIQVHSQEGIGTAITLHF